MRREIYYYVTGHTSDGFVNYLESNVVELDHVVVLKHPSHYVKTDVLNRLLETVDDKADVEVLLSPLAYGDLDGVIIREKSLAVVVDTVMDADLASRLSGVFEVDLELFTTETISKDDHGIRDYYDTLTEEAHKQFKAGLELHDELEDIYIHEMDFSRADELADELIQKMLKDVEYSHSSSKQYKRMFGTNTPEGAVNIIPDLTSPLSKRYYLKGRAGTGKSHLMKTVMSACEAYGLDMEIYYCSFDPGSVDMVLIRDLSCCIFDSTDPHEFFPEAGDETIDLYEEAVTPGTDEAYAESISDLTKRYKAHMKEGIKKLAEAREWLDEQIGNPLESRSRVPEEVISFLYNK